MMRFFLALPLLAAFALSGCACGDLSEEDLVFLASVPSKEQLDLRPAGAKAEETDAADAAGANTARQALEADPANNCDNGDLRCNAQQAARGFNSLTFGLLDIVDGVLAQPPSERSPGRRVWGPFYLADKNQTVRFEMTRNDDARSFHFCLHGAEGFVRPEKAKSVNCDADVDDDSKLALVLSGNFTPGDVAGDAARSGSGDLALRTDRVPELGNAARELDIAFDNTDGSTNIGMSLVGVVFNGVELPNPLDYDFHRAQDGSGDLHFSVLGNIAEPTPRLERLTIDARWDTSQAGRAEGTVTGGDVPDGQAAFENQCWDGDGNTVFVEGQVPGSDLQTTGDVELCVFDPDEVPVAAPPIP